MAINYTGGTPSNAQNHYLIFGVILFMLIVLAFTRVFYSHFVADRLSAYTASRHLKQLMRRELVLYHPYSLITLLLFAMAVSLVFLKAREVFNIRDISHYEDYVFFLLSTGVVLVWVIARALILKLIQFTIGFDLGQTENRYRIIVFNQVCGYMLIPLVAMAYFVKSPADFWIIVICLGLLGLNYLYRIVQSLITGFNYSVNLLYLFLYLCTLEIVPVLIFVSLINYKNG